MLRFEPEVISGGAAFVVMTGDVIGNSSANLVDKISNATGPFFFKENSVLSYLGVKPRTSDLPTTDTVIGGQSAFATATGTNRKGGNVYVDLASPTNGGLVEAQFLIKRGGGNILGMGTYDTALPAYGAIWIGLGPYTASNPILFGDGSMTNSLNVAAAGTFFMCFGANPAAAGSIGFAVSSGATWSELSNFAGIRISPRTTNVATAPNGVYGQNAYSGATGTNRYGGSVELGAGAGYIGTSFSGSVKQLFGGNLGYETFMDRNTSATAATVQIISLRTASNTTYKAMVHVIATRTDSPPAKIRCVTYCISYKNVAGTLSVTNTTTVSDSGVADAASAIGLPTVFVSGTDLQILSNQPGASVILWQATVEVMAWAFA